MWGDMNENKMIVSKAYEEKWAINDEYKCYMNET